MVQISICVWTSDLGYEGSYLYFFNLGEGGPKIQKKTAGEGTDWS